MGNSDKGREESNLSVSMSHSKFLVEPRALPCSLIALVLSFDKQQAPHVAKRQRHMHNLAAKGWKSHPGGGLVKGHSRRQPTPVRVYLMEWVGYLEWSLRNQQGERKRELLKGKEYCQPGGPRGQVHLDSSARLL